MRDAEPVELLSEDILVGADGAFQKRWHRGFIRPDAGCAQLRLVVRIYPTTTAKDAEGDSVPTPTPQQPQRPQPSLVDLWSDADVWGHQLSKEERSEGGAKGSLNQPRAAKAKGSLNQPRAAKAKGGLNQPYAAKAKGGRKAGRNQPRTAKAKGGRNGAGKHKPGAGRGPGGGRQAIKGAPHFCSSGCGQLGTLGRRCCRRVGGKQVFCGVYKVEPDPEEMEES